MNKTPQYLIVGICNLIFFNRTELTELFNYDSKAHLYNNKSTINETKYIDFIYSFYFCIPNAY